MNARETVSASPTVRARASGGISAFRDYGIVVSFLALFLTLVFTSDVFLTQANVLNVLDQSAAVGLMAAGGTLVIVAGGFDLSVGAVFAIAGVVAAKAAPHMAPALAYLLGSLVGLVIGVLNGLLTTIGRINPIVATLGSSIIIRGVALVMTSGFLVTVTDPDFTRLGQGKFGAIHYSVFIWAAFALAAGLVLARSVAGRYIYASGGSPEAARLSGIRVGVVRTAAYASSGLSAGIAGTLVTSRVATGQADAGSGIEISVIAAIVIGGTSIMGGEGAVWRSMLGVLLLAMIGNGFNLLGVNPIYQQILQGGIILSAVAVDAWARRSSG